jgi:hypothetical protein
MKRCPECTSRFPDSFEFCERDGATLVPDYWDSNAKASEAAAKTDKSPPPADEPNVDAPATSYVDPPAVVGTIVYPVSVATRLRQNWIMLALMIIAGLAIALVVVYQPFTREAPSSNANELIANGALTQQPMPALPSRPFPSPSESPSRAHATTDASLALASVSISERVALSGSVTFTECDAVPCCSGITTRRLEFRNGKDWWG